MKDNLMHAKKWFQLHNIAAFIKNNSLYVDIGNFELELSKNEIKYRASEYIRIKQNNLLST